MNSKYLDESVKLSIEKFKSEQWPSVTQKDWANLARAIQDRISARPLPYVSMKVRANLLAFRDAYRVALRCDGDIYYVYNLPRSEVSEDHLSLSERVENGIARALEHIEKSSEAKFRIPIEFQSNSNPFYTRNLEVLLGKDMFPDPWKLHMSLQPYLKELLEVFEESEWRDDADGGPREEPTVRIWERDYRS